MNIINEIDVQIEKIQRNSQTIKEFICSQERKTCLTRCHSRTQVRPPSF